MICFLACIESVGFYTNQPYRGSNWVRNFRQATWFKTLEEAKAIPADIYLRADINVFENGDHSKSPIVEHRRGKYRAYCRNCNQPYGHGQLTRAAAIRKYELNISGKCEHEILNSLQDASKLTDSSSLQITLTKTAV